MPVRDSYPDGAPCWSDLTCADPLGAQDFYGPIMGWEFQELGPAYDGYTMCLLDGRPAAALMRPPAGAERLPSAWNVYLATSELASVLDRVTRAGGTAVLGPHQVPGAGLLAFAFDPAGAAFGLWQAGGHHGAAVYGEPGAVCWHELTTPEADGSDAFFAELFPYQQKQVGDGRAVDYTEWSLPGSAGLPVCGRSRAAVPQPHWATYFAVPEADHAADQVRGLGGRVLRDPFDSPYGRMVPCTDPGGARVTFCQLP
ncbi:VOC family protein [Kitasatospora sp. NBC_01287]|uniref:VOC family protein n=1 Tax=Kitasatospora sp. NBC_01287 TaxID=2903573 RepID=UPI00224D89F0|nr:VOC family protein [Kitasatospora sp. NBC_01287]MCX4748821.1 VOC family protein [Kitasatospora sp. NBC_01287]